MIKLLLKIAALVALIVLAIIIFIKLLPWCIAIMALMALAKFAHDWLRRQGITPSAWWPGKKETDQQGSVPQ